jgi:V-type H+-transporting ATPase subunit a
LEIPWLTNLLAQVNSRLRELHVTLEAGTRQSETLLGQIAQNLADWNLQVSREKAVYHTLNKLSIDVTRKCLIAEGWCPTGDPRIHQEPHVEQTLLATEK